MVLQKDPKSSTNTHLDILRNEVSSKSKVWTQAEGIFNRAEATGRSSIKNVQGLCWAKDFELSEALI